MAAVTPGAVVCRSCWEPVPAGSARCPYCSEAFAARPSDEPPLDLAVGPTERASRRYPPASTVRVRETHWYVRTVLRPVKVESHAVIGDAEPTSEVVEMMSYRME